MSEGQASEGKAGDAVPKLDQAELTGCIIQARKDHHRALADKQLLQNRLAHLRQEQEKARKKIQETLSRSKEIKTMKERNMAKAQEKELYRVTRAGSVDLDKTHIATRRAEKEVAKKKKKLTTQQGKRRVISNMKREKIRIRAEREKQKEVQVQKNREKCLRIQQKQAAQRKAREAAKKAAEAKQRRARLQKLKKYEESTVQANEEILDMEKLEQRLIEDLKETQEIQRKAYEELETVLSEQMD